MKQREQDHAKNLYFQTNMSKTEIAEKTGVNRKTILFWARQGNWDALKMSAIHMPSMVAEKCYHLLDQYMSLLLSEANSMSTFTYKDAQTIHLLANTIKKLKNRSAVNESMEMFGFFMDGLSRRNPALAEAVAPEIETYISIRKNVTTADFMLEGFNETGKIPYPDNDIQEQLADQRDEADLARDFAEFMAARSSTVAEPMPQPASLVVDKNEVPETEPAIVASQPTPVPDIAPVPETTVFKDPPASIPPELDYREANIAMRKSNYPDSSNIKGHSNLNPANRLNKPGSATSTKAA
jgi:hypothetical protein